MTHALNNMPYLKYEKKLIELTEEQAKDIAIRIDKRQSIPFGIERFDFKKCEIYKQLPYNYQEFEIDALPKENILPNNKCNKCNSQGIISVRTGIATDQAYWCTCLFGQEIKEKQRLADEKPVKY